VGGNTNFAAESDEPSAKSFTIAPVDAGPTLAMSLHLNTNSEQQVLPGHTRQIGFT
jgi:hypothetical protein